MGVYLGAEQAMVDQWVEARLAAETVALEAISVGLAGRVYNMLAPTGAKYPYVVYQCQVTPRDVRGVGVSRVMVDTLYVVKAVTQTTTYDRLAPIARVIDTAMTSEAGSPVADGFVLSSAREEGFSLTESVEGTQIRNLGGIYRIHAQA